MEASRYIDLHTHTFHHDPNEVTAIVNIGLEEGLSIPSIGLFSAGWHPWFADKASFDHIDLALESALAWPGIIALGECGLDRSCPVDFEIQKNVFVLHLEKARQYGFPVIIHCVRACSDLLHLLKSSNFDGAFVLHSFRGNAQQTEQLLRFGAYFSFGPAILNGLPTQTSILRQVPDNRLFLETDTSETNITKLYHKAASLRNTNAEILKIKIAENFIQWRRNKQ